MKAPETQKIKKGFIGFFKIFWQNLLLFMLALVIIDLIIGGLLFWRYFLNEQEVEIQEAPLLVINETLFTQFMDTWKAREQAFVEVSERDFPDPFSGEFVNDQWEYLPQASSTDIVG